MSLEHSEGLSLFARLVNARARCGILNPEVRLVVVQPLPPAHLCPRDQLLSVAAEDEEAPCTPLPMLLLTPRPGLTCCGDTPYVAALWQLSDCVLSH